MTDRKKCELRNEIGDCSVMDLPCKDLFESDCETIRSKYGSIERLRKVIKGMEFCSQIGGCNKKCPYHDDSIGTCMISLRREALEMLRKLEKLWEEM